MALEVERRIIEATGATRCREIGMVQRLWSGYGRVLRYELEGTTRKSLIVKHISPPAAADHPRGWNTDRSHQRKLRSYQIESVWYQRFAARAGDGCRLPECLAIDTHGDEILFLLEDLDASGFPMRKTTVRPVELHACLGWLAHFHATYMGCPADGLWPCGTYWHLETRPDEMEQLATEDPALWEAAGALDAMLGHATHQTLVHGDAKLANFCFSPQGDDVAAVDFQYVGKGCGMKDVAYFIGSCFGEDECESHAPGLLDFYFKQLRTALIELGSDVDADALESEWRDLYPVAWTDFHRFLKGWSPGHWKIHSYSERLARQVLAQINQES